MLPFALRICSEQRVDFMKGPALGVNSAIQEPNSAVSEILASNQASKTLAERKGSVEQFLLKANAQNSSHVSSRAIAAHRSASYHQVRENPVVGSVLR